MMNYILAPSILAADFKVLAGDQEDGNKRSCISAF